jgi:hypothetical protein
MHMQTPSRLGAVLSSCLMHMLPERHVCASREYGRLQWPTVAVAAVLRMTDCRNEAVMTTT